MKFFNRLFVVLVISAMTGVVALAEGKSKSVTFTENVSVSGTVVKRGTYKVTFDDQSNELTIERNGKTVAKAAARAEKRDQKVERTQVNTRKNNNVVELSSITFGGDNQSIVVGSGGGQAAGAQK
ncbi:MAG TPA: DUF2911 domain-containing protein [Pyrinomonadaceae bacterium]|jgi:hypothetical protein|nr:DUF2911 domain-containing protein [Pyrinomonadaceae bacterium]